MRFFGWYDTYLGRGAFYAARAESLAAVKALCNAAGAPKPKPNWMANANQWEPGCPVQDGELWVRQTDEESDPWVRLLPRSSG